MTKQFNRAICLLLVITSMITLGSCKPNKKDPKSSSITSGGSSKSSTLNTGSVSGNTSQDSNVLKPVGSSSGASSTSGTTSASSGPIQTVNDDLSLNTPQEKKFASLKGTTIRVCATAEELKPGSNTAVKFDYYKTKYGIKYDIVSLGYKDLQTKLSSMVAAGNPPDSVFITQNEFLRWTYSNVLQPMDSYLVDDPDWVEPSRSFFRTNNKTYAITLGIPQNDLFVYMLYFNKTLFKENNVKDPYQHYLDGTWTWAQLVDTAKKMTLYREDGKTVKTYGVACWNKMVYVLANGGKGLVETKPGVFESYFDKPAEIGGLQTLYNLVQLPMGQIDPYTAFGNRTLAMHIERPANAIAPYDYYNTMDDEIGMAPLPKAADGKYYAPVEEYGVAIPRGAKNPLGGAMIAFESFKLEKDRMFKNPSAYDLAQRKRSISDNHLKILQDYLKNATQVNSFIQGLASWQDDTKLGDQFWGKIIIDKMTPAAAVDSMNGILKQAIKRTTG